MYEFLRERIDNSEEFFGRFKKGDSFWLVEDAGHWQLPGNRPRLVGRMILRKKRWVTVTGRQDLKTNAITYVRTAYIEYEDELGNIKKGHIYYIMLLTPYTIFATEDAAIQYISEEYAREDELKEIGITTQVRDIIAALKDVSVIDVPYESIKASVKQIVKRELNSGKMCL